jgi:hypothetical protein
LFSALYLLGTDAGWDIVETAETDKDEAVGLAAARVTPLSIDAEYHARYAKLIGSIAQSADDQVARAALDCLQYWAPYAVDTVPAILGQALVHMGRANKAVWTSAADSLVLISSTMTGERALAAAVEQLVQYGPQPDSGDESDRPPYRRIQYVANSLGEKVRTDLRTYRASGLSLSALFATHQLVREAAVLRCASIELDGNVLCELEQVIALCTDRPLLAFQTSNSFRQRLSRYVGSSGPFVTVASQLAATGRLADGLFAVAIVQQYGARLKWPAEWRDLVRSLRSHPSLDVREIATCLNTA